MPAFVPTSTSGRCAAVLAVIGVIASLTFVVLTISEREGADTPVDVTRRLVQSIVDNDRVGALDALAPTERSLLADRGDDVLRELERLGLLTPFDHRHVPGVTVRTDALAFVTEPLAASITAVDIVAGRSTLVLDQAQPVADPARELLREGFEVAVEPGTYTRDFAQYPLRVVTVHDGTGWHVSLAYSIAEAWRGAAPAGRTPPTTLEPRQPTDFGTTTTLPPPQYAHALDPVGAPSADEVVRTFVQALVDEDPAKAVGLVERSEAPVLADYLPLMTPAATERRPSKIDKLELQVDGDGPERKVRVKALEADLIGVVQNVHLTYTGSCFTAAYRFGAEPPYVSFERCNGQVPATTEEDEAEREEQERDRGSLPVATTDPDRASSTGDDADPESRAPDEAEREAEERQEALERGGETQVREGEAPPRDNVLGALAVFGGGIELPTFTVVERDGRWFLSPARTIVDSALATVRALQPDDATQLIDRLRRSVAPRPKEDVLRESLDPDNALFGPRATANQPLVARCFTDILSTVGEYGMAAYGPQCLRQLVSSGAVEPGAVEGMVLFGECLNAKPEAPPALTSGVRQMFLADRAVRLCLQRHVDAGEAPAQALDRMNRPEDQPCFAAYQRLAATAPEPEWAAADAEAAACLGARLGAESN